MRRSTKTTYHIVRQVADGDESPVQFAPEKLLTAKQAEYEISRLCAERPGEKFRLITHKITVYASPWQYRKPQSSQIEKAN